jgi:tetratricopeptide (TPR) repeat protein
VAARRRRTTSDEGFTLDPPTLRLDPTTVDPADAHALVDVLDERNVRREDVDAAALLDVGLAYVGIEQYEGAIDSFRRAAVYTDDDALAAEAWANRGVAHAQLEEYDEAVGASREALALDPPADVAAVAETNLAYTLWELGDSSTPLAHAERAVELDPRLPQAWYNLGFLYNERALPSDALWALDGAVRLGLRTPWVREERARALAALDAHAEAATERERAGRTTDRLVRE